jgi:hypothetical protein
VSATLRRRCFGEDPANRWVVPVAVGLVAVQLVYRSWATWGVWWEDDDLTFIAKVFAPGGLSPQMVLTGIAGHIMPGGLYLTWAVNRIAPLDFHLAAVCLIVLQALANVALLRLLLTACGRRWGIIPPLVVYLATAFTIQNAVWWATGIQSIPVQIALFFALNAQLHYLRGRRVRDALTAMAWVLVGLAFYEKSLLIIAALGIVTLAYFTEGRLGERLRQVWHRYRVSLVGNTVLGAAYLVLYMHFASTFGPGGATKDSIGPVLDVVVLRTWGTGIVGGPLVWRHPAGIPVSFAQPAGLAVLAAWVFLIVVVREVVRSRPQAARALWLPAFFLAANAVLLAAGRSLGGPQLGYEYRYIGELSAVTAVALAFAIMPILGATQPVHVTHPSRLLDHRRTAGVATVVVAVLATISTWQYVTNWHDDEPGKPYFQNLAESARSMPPGTQVIDSTVPDVLIWALNYPNNLVSRILAPLHSRLDFATVATDRVDIVGPDGRFRQAVIFPTRRGVEPAHRTQCPHRVDHRVRTIRLDGPLAYGGWWVRVSYLATADSAVTVSAGGMTQLTSVRSGVHDLYFATGGDRFDSIRIGGLLGGAYLCTDDIVAGRPVPEGP